MFFFWMIFLTLMLPVEVRILPTYEVIANFGMLDTYAGLSIPLIASATATFMFRQTFMTIPDELMEASRIDGASPMRFFFDVVIPMSRTNIAALFVILFIFGWNQYLWPLLVTTDPDMYTVVMSIKQMLESGESEPMWHLIMMTALVAMLPPILVVIFRNGLFRVKYRYCSAKWCETTHFASQGCTAHMPHRRCTTTRASRHNSKAKS